MNEKRKTEILSAYNKHYGRHLWLCYKQPSQAKINAWNNIMLEVFNRDGKGLTVTAYNSNCFSCAYTYTDPKTDVKMLCYHTPTQKHEFPITQ